MKFSLIVFLCFVQLIIVFGDVPFDYCSLNDNICEGKRHIACDTLQTKLSKGFKASLPETLGINVTVVGLSDTDKISLVNFTNAQRNKIALGQTPLPTGSSLPKTVWDDELELFAKSLAEIQSILNEGEFCFKRRNGNVVYSNLLLFKRNPPTVQDAVRDIQENTENHVEHEEVSTDALKEASFLTKMGCYFGHTTIQTKSDVFETGLSCIMDFGMERYASRNLYAEGEPCSKCKNDVGCDSFFIGLCATT